MYIEKIEIKKSDPIGVEYNKLTIKAINTYNPYRIRLRTIIFL